MAWQKQQAGSILCVCVCVRVRKVVGAQYCALGNRFHIRCLLHRQRRRHQIEVFTFRYIRFHSP